MASLVLCSVNVVVCSINIVVCDINVVIFIRGGRNNRFSKIYFLNVN